MESQWFLWLPFNDQIRSEWIHADPHCKTRFGIQSSSTPSSMESNSSSCLSCFMGLPSDFHTPLHHHTCSRSKHCIEIPTTLSLACCVCWSVIFQVKEEEVCLCVLNLTWKIEEANDEYALQSISARPIQKHPKRALEYVEEQWFFYCAVFLSWRDQSLYLFCQFTLPLSRRGGPFPSSRITGVVSGLTFASRFPRGSNVPLFFGLVHAAPVVAFPYYKECIEARWGLHQPPPWDWCQQLCQRRTTWSIGFHWPSSWVLRPSVVRPLRTSSNSSRLGTMPCVQHNSLILHHWISILYLLAYFLLHCFETNQGQQGQETSINRPPFLSFPLFGCT